MFGLLKIFAAFAAIVFMVRKKMHLGTSVLIGSILLAAFSGAGHFFLKSGNVIAPVDFLSIVWREASSPSTLKLTSAILLVLTLSHCLEKTGQMDEILRSFQALVRDTRVVLMALPALIGLLPMPGGAVFSAPLVEELQTEVNLSPTKKTLINYWFRHLWEYSWPLYPGLLVAAGEAKKWGMNVSVFKLAVLQSPLTAAALLGGLIFILRKVPRAVPSAQTETPTSRFSAVILGLSPILTIMAVVALLSGPAKMDSEAALPVALITATVLTLGTNSLKKHVSLFAALRGLPLTGLLKFAYMVGGLMVFRGTIHDSGAVWEVSAMMKTYHVPLIPFIVLLSFISGLVTGLTMAYVGILFPIFIPLVLQVTPDPLPFLILAFGCGFIGVLFSPVHVCLILTHQYFKSDFASVYRGMIGPVLVVFGTLIAMFLALYLTPLSG